MKKHEPIENFNISSATTNEEWSDLTVDELLKIEEHKDHLIGAVQKRFGISKDKAEKIILSMAN